MNADDELAALVAGVLKDLDGAGALADWLQEHDREREAYLLRQRWKAWKKKHARASRLPVGMVEIAKRLHPADAAGVENRMIIQREGIADKKFREYVRTRFAGVRLEDVTHWCLDGNFEWGHIVLCESGGVCTTACGSMIWNGSTTERPKGVCARCRNKLPDLRRTPPADAE